MEIALVDGVRSPPLPGVLGHCQPCGAPMVAKCGEQLVWHWAHRGRRVCDPWWENEGEWHRAWKEHFPSEWHEFVQHDNLGEKHIADVRLPSGLVIELQHSAMPLDEMRSREAFYGNMLWIVDAGPFKHNLAFFDALPDPTEPFVEDLKFFTPHPAWSTRTRSAGFDGLMFHRRSEHVAGFSMQRVYSGRELAPYFPACYTGHHLFRWMRPREVWLQTTKPTYLDVGDDLLALISRYGPWEDTFTCVRFMSKQKLIADLRSPNC